MVLHFGEFIVEGALPGFNTQYLRYYMRKYLLRGQTHFSSEARQAERTRKKQIGSEPAGD